MSTIFDAIKRDDRAAVTRELRGTPDVCRIINDLHDTPLHEASRLGLMEVASLLLDAGADVNAVGDLGKTPLHYAAQRDQTPELATLLIIKGADIERPNRTGEKPLDVAARQNPEVAAILLRHGAQLDLNSAVSLGLFDEAMKLLRRDPSMRDVRFPGQLVEQAVRANAPKILELMLAHGLKPNSLALFAALERTLNGMGHVELIRMLLQAGADPNGKLYGYSGETPLEYATLFKGATSEKVIALLKEYGATR